MKHPNPGVPEMRMAWQTPASWPRELGLTGKHVFFNEGWVPYERARRLPARRRRRRLARTSSTSRPRSASAPGSSTTCGRRCRSSPPTGDTFGDARRATRPRARRAGRGRRRARRGARARCSTTTRSPSGRANGRRGVRGRLRLVRGCSLRSSSSAGPRAGPRTWPDEAPGEPDRRAPRPAPPWDGVRGDVALVAGVPGRRGGVRARRAARAGRVNAYPTGEPARPTATAGCGRPAVARAARPR